MTVPTNIPIRPELIDDRMQILLEFDVYFSRYDEIFQNISQVLRDTTYLRGYNEVKKKWNRREFPELWIGDFYATDHNFALSMELVM